MAVRPALRYLLWAAVVLLPGGVLLAPLAALGAAMARRPAEVRPPGA